MHKQIITAIFNQLVKEGKIEKVAENRESRFRLIEYETAVADYKSIGERKNDSRV